MNKEMIEKIKGWLEDYRADFKTALDERHEALNAGNASEAEARFAKMAYAFGKCDAFKQILSMVEGERVC